MPWALAFVLKSSVKCLGIGCSKFITKRKSGGRMWSVSCRMTDIKRTCTVSEDNLGN